MHCTREWRLLPDGWTGRLNAGRERGAGGCKEGWVRGWVDKAQPAYAPMVSHARRTAPTHHTTPYPRQITPAGAAARNARLLPHSGCYYVALPAQVRLRVGGRRVKVRARVGARARTMTRVEARTGVMVRARVAVGMAVRPRVRASSRHCLLTVPISLRRLRTAPTHYHYRRHHRSTRHLPRCTRPARHAAALGRATVSFLSSRSASPRATRTAMSLSSPRHRARRPRAPPPARRAPPHTTSRRSVRGCAAAFAAARGTMRTQRRSVTVARRCTSARSSSSTRSASSCLPSFRP